MNSTRFQLLEKLRQSKLAAALTRSKSITASSAEMPVCSAILAEAKRLGIAADEVAAGFVSGKIAIPEIDMLMGKKPIATASAAPHGLAIAGTSAKPATATPAPQNPMSKKPAPQKPVRQTAYSTFAKLQQIDPVKASVFLAVNRPAILASKPADLTIQS